MRHYEYSVLREHSEYALAVSYSTAVRVLKSTLHVLPMHCTTRRPNRSAADGPLLLPAMTQHAPALGVLRVPTMY